MFIESEWCVNGDRFPNLYVCDTGLLKAVLEFNGKVDIFMSVQLNCV